jgi:hypothetical protein
MSARDAIWELLGDDPILNQMGLTRDNLFVNWSGDSPAAFLTNWVALRWGVADAPVGRGSQTRPVVLGVWAYDREPHYTGISDRLWRIRQVMLGIAGYRLPGGGSILQADWSTSSEDLRDDTMEAVLRSETYRIVTDAI